MTNPSDRLERVRPEGMIRFLLRMPADQKEAIRILADRYDTTMTQMMIELFDIALDAVVEADRRGAGGGQTSGSGVANRG